MTAYHGIFQRNYRLAMVSNAPVHSRRRGMISVRVKYHDDWPVGQRGAQIKKLDIEI